MQEVIRTNTSSYSFKREYEENNTDFYLHIKYDTNVFGFCVTYMIMDQVSAMLVKKRPKIKTLIRL